MIWLTVIIIWALLTIAVTLVGYIDFKLSSRLMTTKQCFNSALLKGLFVSTVICGFSLATTVDWAELFNYRAIFGWLLA